MWTTESAARALTRASPAEWDVLLGDAGFLVHIDPGVLKAVVPLTYRPRPEPAGQALDVYRTVAHRLVDLAPAERAQVLSVQAIRFRAEDRFASTVNPGVWSCVWASGGSAPGGLLAQLPQPSGETVAVGCSAGQYLAVTSDSDDGALRVWDLAHGVQIGQPLLGCGGRQRLPDGGHGGRSRENRPTLGPGCRHHTGTAPAIATKSPPSSRRALPMCRFC